MTGKTYAHFCHYTITVTASKPEKNFTHTHTHTFNGPFPGLPGCAGTRKAKPIWILLEQETVSGSGISWAMQVRTSLQTDNHASTPPCFYTPYSLPAAQPTASKH